jgi:uncharacterized protein (TIGR03435 family)
MSGSVTPKLNFAEKTAWRGIEALMASILAGTIGVPMIRAQSASAAPWTAQTAHTRAVAQTAVPAERFDVASVKVNTAGGGGYPGLASGGQRFTAANLPLTALILLAYDVTPRQVLGVPGALDAMGFDIEAKSEQPMTRAQSLRMLQTLLAERFRLTLHRETREQPIYALVIAKAEPKLRDSLEDSPVPTIKKQANGSFVFKGTPMATLTLILSQQVGRTVVDKTGLQGKYDFSLAYEREQAGRGGADGSESAVNPNGLPSVFTALQEQLGLKLESQKGPVEFIIVDYAQKPSAN